MHGTETSYKTGKLAGRWPSDQLVKPEISNAQLPHARVLLGWKASAQLRLLIWSFPDADRPAQPQRTEGQQCDRELLKGL